MKKIYINRAVVDGPYGGGNNFVRALYEKSLEHGFIPTNSLTEDVDAIFMIDPRYDQKGLSIREIAAYKAYRPSTKLFYRINECDKRKGDIDVIDPLISYASQFCDACFFISDWIMNYHTEKNWLCDNNFKIYSGTNKEHFRPREKILNGKINLVTHHWSDNPLKGQDVYEKIDEWLSESEDFTFTYIGRSKANLKNSNIIGPTFGLDLGKTLSKFDVYISASRFDPGPNHIIESLACNIPTYAHADSGGAVEMVGHDHIFEDFNSLKDILLTKKFASNTSLVPKDWDACINDYFEVIRDLV